MLLKNDSRQSVNKEKSETGPKIRFFIEKVPFDELLKKICKGPAPFYFLRNEEKLKMRSDRSRSLMEIMQTGAFSLLIFSTKENLP